MKGQQQHDPMLEAGLRQELNAAEQARLQAIIDANPDQAASWREDLRLNRILRGLPNKPVASNFTAQVIAAVQAATPQRPRVLIVVVWRWLGAWHWSAKSALAALALALCIFGYYNHNYQRRAEVASSIAEASNITALLNTDLLRDFEAINRLSQVPPVLDEELLAALK